MKLVWGIWVLTQALSTALLARKLPSPRFPCFPWNRQSAISSRQLGAFCSSRGSSKRGYYFTYLLLYSAHHYPISYVFTSPKDWRRVKFQEGVRNGSQGSKRGFSFLFYV